MLDVLLLVVHRDLLVFAWTGTWGLPSRVLALSLIELEMPLRWVGKNLMGDKPPITPLLLASLLRLGLLAAGVRFGIFELRSFWNLDLEFEISRTLAF